MVDDKHCILARIFGFAPLSKLPKGGIGDDWRRVGGDLRAAMRGVRSQRSPLQRW